MKARDGSGWVKRTHKTPCEASIGCAKGHYNQNPDLNETQEAVITLYLASRSTGGAVLNEAERADWWLAETFGKLREIEERVNRSTMETMILGAITRG